MDLKPVRSGHGQHLTMKPTGRWRACRRISALSDLRRKRLTQSLAAVLLGCFSLHTSQVLSFLPGPSPRSINNSQSEIGTARRQVALSGALAGLSGAAPAFAKSGGDEEYSDLEVAALKAIDSLLAEKEAAKKPAAPAVVADPFDVVLDVDLGGDSHKKSSFTVKIHPEWAPKGAEHFKNLVKQGWFTENSVFKVQPGVAAYFGLPPEPSGSVVIKDDPPKVSNTRGTLVFNTRGPNSRASQVIINLGDNPKNDKKNFVPFGEVIDDGMQVVDAFYQGYAERGPDVSRVREEGAEYVDQFPKIAKIKKARLQK